MPSAGNCGVLFVLLAALFPAAGAARFGFHIPGDDAGSWPAILGSIGLKPEVLDPEGDASSNLFVIRSGSAASPAEWLARIEMGAIVILEGDSAVAQALGFRPGARRMRVRSVIDTHRPNLPIIWERPLDLPRFETPVDARIFARERWEQAPLVAGVKRGMGAALWVAASPGPQGYERFPYLLHALAALGLEPPFHSTRLWAFFDSAYRSRADLDYLAERWRRSGVGALHVAAWHFHERDPQKDEYLRRLIEACHKRAILVYAWLELPHVSEAFWRDHPEWREQTALLQDAHLDWRKLMNLVNRDCFRAVSAGVRDLIRGFDWDGVNLAELYFESLEGHGNAARFTPMNGDIRAEFRASEGHDPIELFQEASPGHFTRAPAALAGFLRFRAGIARRLQFEWIAEIEKLRREKPHLDLVLTHVDDQLDTRMKDLIGADAAQLLPLLDRHDFTFLVEDPATLWHLGPKRYSEIRSRYRPLTPHQDKLAIDINIVERYQDVYPTRQQTGTELFQLLQVAAGAFPRVALYFENSILTPDLPFLPSASCAVDRVARTGSKLIVESAHGAGVSWKGPAMVNGRPWPVYDGAKVWLPAGSHAIEAAVTEPAARILDFNGELKTAEVTRDGLTFSYHSGSRAIAVIDRRPARVEVDGVEENRVVQNEPDSGRAGERFILRLPRGQHVVSLIYGRPAQD